MTATAILAPVKTCTKCGQIMPATLEFFHRHGPSPDGMSYRCKPCLKVYKDAHYQKNKESILKQCAAYKAADPDLARARVAAWRKANSKKAYAAAQAWKLANADRARAVYESYYQLHRDEIRAASAAWVKANPEQASASRRAWRIANPEARLLAYQNRRARLRGNGGILSAGIKSKLILAQKGMCACCKLPLGDSPHLDHIMPLALGGKNEDGNMQMLRAFCNMSKQDKHPIDYMQSRGFLL